MTAVTASGPVEYVEINGRRAYVARITGTDPRYGLAREWAPKVKNHGGRRGLWAKVTEPGWYEIVTYTYTGRRIAYEAYDGTDWEPIPRALFASFAAHAVAGPAPGRPGAWYGDRCHCGAPVEHYTPAGMPRCEAHHETETETEKEHAA